MNQIFGRCSAQIYAIISIVLGLLFFGQNTQTASNNAFPRWSHDGKKIVFMSDRTGDPEIYVMNADGSNPVRLTNAPGRDAHPYFSRDGRKIVFQSPRANGVDTNVYVMNSDGSDAKQLTHLKGFAGVPVYSPDEKQIVFQWRESNNFRDEKKWRICMMNPDGSNSRVITPGTSNDQVPNWSRDGQRLLFFSDRTGKNQLYTMKPDGTDVQRLTVNEFDDTAAYWSPDNKKIAFTSTRDGNTDVYVMDADGRNVRQLTQTKATERAPVWSPDGKKIAFSSDGDGPGNIYVINADGTGFKQLTNQGLPQVEEGYVPTDDGTRLYYQKTGHGSQTLIIPGSLFTFETFKQLADKYTVIAYDMRGRGRSDAIPDEQKAAKISIQDDVKDVERIRQHFKVQKASLIGYSYLGLMVVMYAMEHPERVERIVQIGPVPIKFNTKYPDHLTATDDPGEKLVAELRQLRKENYHVTHPKEYCEKEWAYSRLRLVGNSANANKLGPSQCEMPNEWPVNLAKHFEYSFVSVQKLDLPKEKIAGVKLPVLTIHGTKDRNAPYGSGREWAMTLPNARLLTVPGAAHQVFAEFPEIVLPAIRTFLAGRWSEGVEKVTALNMSM